MDSKPRMTESQIKQPAWDVSQAWEEWQAARAAGDAEAELLAMRRWSEAQTNASIGLVGQIVRPLADQIANARTADLDWRTEERSRRDKQADRLYNELDELRTGQAQIPAAVQEAVALEMGKVIPRIEAVEAGQAALADKVNNFGEEQSQIKTDVSLLKEDMTALKTEVGDVKTRVGRIEKMVRQLAEESGATKATREMLRRWEENNPSPTEDDRA